MLKKDKVNFTIQKLSELYPTIPVPLDHKDPYTLLIAVLLSAHSTDVRGNQITPLLFEKADNPYAMVRLSVEEIRDIIRPVGLSPMKSKGIHGLSQILIDKYNGEVPKDIALLEVLGNRDLTLCSSKFFEAVSVASLLNQDNRAQIQLVDGETIGRIGGTVISNDTSYTTLRMRPYQTNDPLVEKGISGGVMLVGGNPVAIVTQVQNPDTDPVIVAVSIGKVRSLFPAYLPSRRRYKKYDISWMPSEFLSAMETVRRSVQIGLMRRSGQKKLQAMRGLSHNVPGRSP